MFCCVPPPEVLPLVMEYLAIVALREGGGFRLGFGLAASTPRLFRYGSDGIATSATSGGNRDVHRLEGHFRSHQLGDLRLERGVLRLDLRIFVLDAPHLVADTGPDTLEVVEVLLCALQIGDR